MLIMTLTGTVRAKRVRPTFKVTVESNGLQKEFHFSKEHLAHFSAWFRSRIEAGSNTMLVSDYDFMIFAAFSQWIQSGELYSTPTAEGKIPLSTNEIIQVYVFGEKIQCPELCNDAIELLFRKTLQCWEDRGDEDLMKHVEDINNSTVPGSPLRMFVVDHAVQAVVWYNHKDKVKKWPKAFMADSLMKFTDMTRAPVQFNYRRYVDQTRTQLCTHWHHHSFDAMDQVRNAAVDQEEE